MRRQDTYRLAVGMMWRKGTLRLYAKMVPRERRRRVALQPLIEEQKRKFVRDGFPHVPELVPLRLLAHVLPQP